MDQEDGTKLCDEDELWVCRACGKTSKSRYGFDKSNQRVSMRGYDESCMMNSAKYKKSRLVHDSSGRVIRVTEDLNKATGSIPQV